MTDETFNTESDFTEEEPKVFLMPSEPIADPQVFIEEFFRAFHLPDALEMFWEMCKGALASQHYDESWLHRSNLLSFAEQVTLLFAAVQQMHAPQAGNMPLTELEQELDTEEEEELNLEDVKELQKEMNFLLDLCSSMSLEETERDLDDWLKVALSTDNLTYADGKDRGNLIALHTQLRTLVRSLHQFSKEVKHERPVH